MPQFIPNDPLFPKQWYLLNTGQTGNPGLDLNVTPVWPDYTGSGVRVAIYDNGIDFNHVDLRANYNHALDATINGQVSDANYLQPSQVGGTTGFEQFNAHGTSIAGVLGASANNGTGIAGVAFNSQIVGVYAPIIGQNPPKPEAVQVMQQLQNYDVADFASGTVSFRGGQADPNWAGFYGGIQSAADNGRGGLGTIMVNAVHNNGPGFGGADGNSSQFDSSRFFTHVGGVTDTGDVVQYSTRGANMLVSAFTGPPVAPGSNNPHNIETTDITGADGFTPGDYVDSNGTTVASPQIAGIAALMLQANPNLGWRDVQSILANAARHTGSAIGSPSLHPSETDPWEINHANNWNGGGRHYSIDYGYGVPDALAAVRMAETWAIGQNAPATSANEINRTATVNSGGLAIPDNTGASVTLDFSIAQNVRVEDVRLVLGVNAPRIQDLTITLTSPDGTVSKIYNPVSSEAGAGQSVPNGWAFASEEFRGELGAGTWHATITDHVSGNVATLGTSTLNVFGSSNTTNTRYVYTNEFGDFASDASRHVLNDTDGGIDTINAAAVTASSFINLAPGSTSTISGQSVFIPVGSVIENAVGGDGDDTLIGNALSNVLYGGRGNDTINGRAGADTLTGGLGADRFILDGAALADATAATPLIDDITDYNQGSGVHRGSEGDQIDLSAILSSAFNHGAGQPVDTLVRAVSNGGVVTLLVDPDGAANGQNFIPIARLDGLHGGNAVNVILDASQPAGSTISVKASDIDAGPYGDVGGDHHSDLVLRNDNGGVALWQINNAGQTINPAIIGAVGPEWHIDNAAADFNGDGKADVLWRADDGSLMMWQMNGTQFQASIFGQVGNEWQLGGTGDFNGDGKADIVFARGDGSLMMFQMNGSQIQSSSIFGQVGREWHLEGIGDFNGDGRSDFFIRNDVGRLDLVFMNGSQIQSSATIGAVGREWHVEGVADFNGDGKADILWKNDSGLLMMWQMNGSQIASSQTFNGLPPDWHIYGTGDFNGDDNADILWRNDNGAIAVWEMNGANIVSPQNVSPLSPDWNLGVHHFDFV